MAAQHRRSALGAELNPVVIEEDEEDLDDFSRRTRRREENVQEARRIAGVVAALNTRNRRAGSDDTNASSQSGGFEEECEIESILAQEIAEVIDLTGDDDISISTAQAAPTREEESQLPSFESADGLLLVPGLAVELTAPLGPHDVEFLRIKSIIRRCSSSEVVLRGWGYVRTKHLDGILPLRRLNELAMIAEIRAADPRPVEEQVLMEASLGSVGCCRELRVTNAPFPEHRFDQQLRAKRGNQWVKENAPLVCRYRYEVHISSIDKPYEWVLAHMDEDSADPEYKVTNAQNLNRWRGGKVPGGSHNPHGLSHPVVDLEAGPSSITESCKLLPGQCYTGGDVFAGAGGASRGIKRAGVKLVFAVDHWSYAVESLRSNFPDSRIYEMDVTDFIMDEDIQHQVDLLHVSPPCQYWSPAHTVAGRNDEQNSAVLFSSAPVIEKHRPRLFTMEQTFGLLNPRFKPYFNMLVRDIVELGCSLRWKVVPLANYGVAQLRRRLIIIGSCPGEKLPPFPAPTHRKGGIGGLKPWPTPKSVLEPLRNCPRDHKLHQPHRIKKFSPPKAPWDPTKLAKTITTNGGQNYHWDGERDFTPLEYAVLQGFPRWHKFEGRYVKKQIGNAFAPTVVKVLYDHLIDFLLVQDGFDPRTRHQALFNVHGNLDSSNVVCLDGLDEPPCSSGGNSIHHHGQAVEGQEGEVIWLESYHYFEPHCSRRLSETVRQLNQAAKKELYDEMDLDGVDELSDTATIRGENDVPELMDVDDNGQGTPGNPFVLSD